MPDGYLRPPRQFSCVPPSPELEKRILKSKRSLIKGEALPEKSGPDFLDLNSLMLIANRPAFTRAHSLGASVASSGGAVGKRRALVILVDFSDHPAKQRREHYQEMLFSSSRYPTGSLRDYYREASYGRLTVEGDVVGGEGGWYRAPKPYSYYCNGEYGFGTYPRNVTRLVEDAIEQASAHVNFAQYDADGDGDVDALFIIHSGPGAETTGSVSDIWSHMSAITPKTIHGVRVSRYSMEPEDGNVGVFCHELGHVFGLPDLYDYDMDSAGTGSWDLMAGGSWNNGGKTPAHPVGWCKVQLGWVTPTVVEKPVENVTIRPSSLFPEMYRLPADGAQSEYFLIENRKKAGFDSYLPGEGLMILHIDESQKNNNDQSRYLVEIEQCDGRCDLNNNENRGDATDPYPTSSNSAFAADTSPASKLYDGRDSRVAVRNVRRKGENIVADLVLGGPAGPVWIKNRTIDRTFAHCASQWAWAHVPDLGWRRIKEKSNDGVSNIFGLACEAVGSSLKVNLYADDCFIYMLYLV
ncbi:MAG: M6 family metalloprotease domain-containing protein [Methanotrichaceae archaeon]|nr:M6 family metalloprotease domain-containing protein [Methanotrichaceae archaeon]